MDSKFDEISNDLSNELDDRITPTIDTDFFLAYQKLPVKTAATIRIFERNEHYTCHGDDALLIARELLHSTNTLKYWITTDSKKPLETIYLSNKQFEDILHELLFFTKYQIEVWKKVQKSSNEWTLAFHRSPINLPRFEHVLCSPSAQSQGSSSVLSCKLATQYGVTVIGLALVDMQTLTIEMCEVTVSNDYSNIEAILVQLNPKECLLPVLGVNEDNYSQLKMIIEKLGILVTERPRVEFSSKDIKQDLCRLLIKAKYDDNDTFEMKVGLMPEMQMEHATAALSAAIKFTQLSLDKNRSNQFHLKTYEHDRYMKLDTAAMVAPICCPDSRQRLDYDDEEKKTRTNVKYLVKCVLGGQLTVDNDDDIEDSMARILFLDSLGLNLCDVADLINKQKDVEWEDKRISKKLIKDLLSTAVDSYSEVIGTEEGWLNGSQLAILHVLATYNLALVDLSRYFNYDDELLEALKYVDMNEEQEIDQPSVTIIDADPTWVHPKRWRKITQIEGAEDAITTNCNESEPWKVLQKLDDGKTCVVKIEFRGQFRAIALSTLDKQNRLIMFCGDHKNYDYYRTKSIMLLVKMFNGSKEKKENPQLSLFEYCRSQEDLQINS